jgi:uncharacterized protein YpmS
MKQKVIVSLLIGLITIFAVVQIVGTGMIADRLAHNLEAEIQEAETIEVNVSAFPIYEILWGQVDKVTISGQGLVADGLRYEELEAVFKNLKVNNQAGEWLVTEGENPSLYLKVNEDDLNQYLSTHPELQIFKQFKVDLTSNQVLITGLVRFLSTDINLQLSGNFEVGSNEQIIFNSEKLAVEDVVIPTQMVEQLKNKLQFKLDLKRLPLPVDVKQVEVNKDRLEVFGDNKNK